MKDPFIKLSNLKRFLENLRVNNTENLELHTTNYDNPHRITKEQIGLGNVDNTSDLDKPVSDAQRDFIIGRDSDVLKNAKLYTDSIKNTTINEVNNTINGKLNDVKLNIDNHINNVTDAHNIANRLQILKDSMKQYTDNSISTLVGGAPQILDTLYELSNALGNDPNFSKTITNMIAGKFDSQEVVNVPTPLKVLRMDAMGRYPASVIAQNADNRFFTDKERIKLANIEEGATNYEHPDHHPPSIITQDANNRFVTDLEKKTWNSKQNKLYPATPNSEGTMTGADKFKLDGIEAGATKTIITNNLITEKTGTALDAAQGKWLNDNKAPISHITNYTNPHKVTKAQVGLGNAENTADINKNVNTAKNTITLGLKAPTDRPSTYPYGLSTHQVYNNGYPAAYGNTITSRGLGTGCTQFFVEWRGDGTGDANPPSTGRVWYRSARDNIDAWSAWNKVGVGSASEITEGVLSISHGGTGTTTKQGIVQMLYDTGNRNSVATASLFTFVFEASGANAGFLTLPDLKKKLEWTTSELQAALNKLPNV